MDAPETRYVTVSGGQLVFQVVGDGPIDLVFNHGLCHVDLRWQPVCEASFLRALSSFSRLILLIAAAVVRQTRSSTDTSRRGRSGTSTCSRYSTRRVGVGGSVRGDRGGSHGDAVRSGPPGAGSLRSIVNNTAARYMAADDYPIGIPSDDIDVIVQRIESLWGTANGFANMSPGTSHDRLLDLVGVARVMRASATPQPCSSPVPTHLRVALRAAAYRWLDSRADARAGQPQRYEPGSPHRTAGPRTIRSRTDTERETCRATRRQHPRLRGQPRTSHRRSRRVPHRHCSATIGGPDSHNRPVHRHRRVNLNRLAAIGDQRWRSLLDAHDRLIRMIIQHHRGQEIKTTGDGFVACFDGPARAVDCAIAIRRGIRDLDLEITAGLHTGECERRGDDIAGVVLRRRPHRSPREPERSTRLSHRHRP